MNSTIGSISALLSQNCFHGDEADDIPRGVLILGDSMIRNIRPEQMTHQCVIKFAYPGITGKQLQNQFKELVQYTVFLYPGFILIFIRI